MLVAGVGALGNEAVKNLALLGVGHLVLVDRDDIDVSNLTRSVLFSARDVGQRKAEVAALAVRQLNPDVEATPVVGDLEFTVGAGLLRSCDLVVGCLDSINARWALNRLCFRTGVPWLNGGINPYAGEVSLYVPGSSGCYECGMSESMWQRFHERYSCTRLLRPAPLPMLPTTIALAAVTAGLLSHEAVGVLHGTRAPQGLRPGQKLFVSVRPPSLFVVDLPNASDCAWHDPLQVDVVVAFDAWAAGVDSLIEAIEGAGRTAHRVVLDHEVLLELRCERCGPEWVARPVQLVPVDRVRCPSCGSEREPALVSAVVPGTREAALPLSQLGVAPTAAVTVDTSAGPLVVQLVPLTEEPDHDVTTPGHTQGSHLRDNG